MRTLCTFVLAGCLTVAVTGSASATTPAAWISRIDSLYNVSPYWKVDFEQTVHYPVFDETETESGTIAVGTGHRFRLQTSKHIVVSDGDTLWTHNIPANQLTIEKVSKAGEVVRPADFLFHFRQDYTPQLCDSPGPGQCIYLKANDETAFIREMWLWADPDNAYVRKAMYRDINGNETTFEFKKFNLKYKAGKDEFRYSAPPGVEVIRMP